MFTKAAKYINRALSYPASFLGFVAMGAMVF
jgi:hypothetical protein